MGQVAERLDSMTIRAQSPDGNVTLTLHKRTQVELSFREYSYEEYDESRLGRQLEAAARGLTDACRQARRAVVAEANGQEQLPEAVSHWNAQRRRFQAERDELAVAGFSRDGRIEITTVGLHEWYVSIESGALDDLSESAFVAMADSAVADLLDVHHLQMYELKTKIYGRVGVTLPDSARR